MVEDVESDESGEQSGEHQWVEQVIACGRDNTQSTKFTNLHLEDILRIERKL